MEYLPDDASFGLAGLEVTSCLSCRSWSGSCRWAGVAAVVRWRRARVSDSDGAVWHFGNFDPTPAKPCPKRKRRTDG